MTRVFPAGTHVSNTSEIGTFKVVSETGVASGVRRIEAVAGQAAVEYLQLLDGVVQQLASNLRVKAEDLPARVVALQVRLLTRHADEVKVACTANRVSDSGKNVWQLPSSVLYYQICCAEARH
jgi:alanyl-tRNA synthetase